MRRRDLITSSFALAIDKGRIDAAIALIQKQTGSGEVYSAELNVHQGSFELSKSFGRIPNPETPFILASITKPMTATAVMILSDRGKLSLSDPVRKHIPEFHGGDRDLITIKHLLTHTSGLPDMLDNNIELRKRHAPLKDFVQATCQTPLLFKPGTQTKYQSMGVLLAAEIAERVTRTPLRDFLRSEVFLPLGMQRTSLGLGGRAISDTAFCQTPNNDDWNANSTYWRNMGVPWGGAHSTAADVAKFLQCFLNGGGPILKPATAQSMITDQNPGLDPWGIGWMLKPGTFGKACSPRTFGHYGSSGTVAWADPQSKLTCVLLTTQPASDSRHGLLGPVSDLVAESAGLPGGAGA